MAGRRNLKRSKEVKSGCPGPEAGTGIFMIILSKFSTFVSLINTRLGRADGSPETTGR
jgi:hypothetical protein